MSIVETLLTITQADVEAAMTQAKADLDEKQSRYDFLLSLHRAFRARSLGKRNKKTDDGVVEEVEQPEVPADEPVAVQEPSETPADEDLSLADILARQLTLSPSGVQRLAILTGEDEADIKVCLTENPKRFEKAMGLWRLVQA